MGMFTKLTGGELSDLSKPPTGDCLISFNKDNYCLGDTATGTLDDGKNANCFIAVNNGSGWALLKNVKTNDVGIYRESLIVNQLGKFVFAGVCLDEDDKFCRTNDKEITVELCGDDDLIYTCGWTGSDCIGTCPDTHPDCVEIDFVGGDLSCACLNSNFEVHPDWKPGEDYYNPHDNIFDEEEYIIGQIGTIFATDLSWNGASGGLDGIDDKCQLQAYYSGLEGTWIAIAGDTSINARTRVSVDVPFYRIDGIIIANSHADLFDGSIQNPININQNGELETGTAWTGSDGAGYYVSDNCNEWKWVDSLGYYGDISSTGYSWLHDNKVECSIGKHFYCVRIS